MGCVPEPIDTQGEIPFCGDIAGMETKTKQCGGGDECCGSLKEYFIRINEDNSTRTDMVAYHGCQKDLVHMLNADIPLDVVATTVST